MRRKLKYGKAYYNPRGHLGHSLESAEDIADRAVAMQVLVIVPGRTPRLLTMRVCGRSRMTATDEHTGQTTESLRHDLAHYRELERLWTLPNAKAAAKRYADEIEAVLREREKDGEPCPT